MSKEYIDTTDPSRVVVRVPRGAETSLVLDADTRSRDTEIVLEQGARLSLYEVDDDTEATLERRITARLHRGATLHAFAATVGGAATRRRYHVQLLEPDASAHLSGLVTAAGEQEVTYATLVEHLAPHCTSSQLYKYIVDGASRCRFEGLIRVAEGAAFTEAHQTNRNLLVSRDATMHTEPQLEIYCDEVKCGHGATTGQLDAEALFYMRTRGIPEAEARTMLMQAFMADVIDTVDLEPLRERLRGLVDSRLGATPQIAEE